MHATFVSRARQTNGTILVSLFLLSWTLLKRDWRAGELQVLLLALIIAEASITSIGIFTQRINLAIHDQSGQFLGADYY